LSRTQTQMKEAFPNWRRIYLGVGLTTLATLLR
jgi:hypothetical protein